MANLVKVVGVNKVGKSLRRKSKSYRKAYLRGLKKAGLFVQRASQVIVPVDTGVLKSSAFTRSIGSEFLPVVIVGYTTIYAIYVHEDLEAQHAPGKKAKFLENPIRDNQDKIRAIVAAETSKAK